MPSHSGVRKAMGLCLRIIHLWAFLHYRREVRSLCRLRTPYPNCRTGAVPWIEEPRRVKCAVHMVRYSPIWGCGTTRNSLRNIQQFSSTARTTEVEPQSL